MAIRTGGAALRQIRTLFHLGVIGHLTDGQLLERFATYEGEVAESAFAALVERHGPMVLRVCRGILRDEHDAQDAFQATFLVLVRKGRSLWVRDSIGPWLHAVALRAAHGARASRERRRSREGMVLASISEPETTPEDPFGIDPVLHEEIKRLPDRFRAPIILCDLEGMSHDQAAHALGCPVGTIKSRLTRGRSKLRDRLARRGITAAVGVGVGLATTGARAAVPALLARSTLGIALRSAVGPSAGGVIPASIAGLARGVSNAMLYAKLKLLIVPLLAVGVAVGSGFDAQGDGHGGIEAPKSRSRSVEHEGNRHGEILLYEVRPGDLGKSVVVRGVLEASRASEVRSLVEGNMTIRSIVSSGNRVEEGEIVCELDPRPLQARLDRHRFVLRRARAELDAAEGAVRIAEVNLEEYQEVIYPRELKTIEGEITLAQSELQRAKDRLSWSEDMLKLGYISQPQNRSDRDTHERAQFNLEEAEKKRDVLLEFTMPKTVKTLESDVETARAARLAAQVALDDEKKSEEEILAQTEQCTLVAPHAGTVFHMTDQAGGLDAGDSVREGQHLFSIFDLDQPLQAVVNIEESRVDLINAGQRAGVRVDAFPRALWQFEGEVTSVAPVPDREIWDRTGEKLYPTVIELSEVHADLRPGLTLEARIRLSEADDAITIPFRSLLIHEGTHYVAVRRDIGRFEWREVSLGLRIRAYVEVEDGLTPGELIALDPIAVLRRDSKPVPKVDSTPDQSET